MTPGRGVAAGPLARFRLSASRHLLVSRVGSRRLPRANATDDICFYADKLPALLNAVKTPQCCKRNRGRVSWGRQGPRGHSASPLEAVTSGEGRGGSAAHLQTGQWHLPQGLPWARGGNLRVQGLGITAFQNPNVLQTVVGWPGRPGLGPGRDGVQSSWLNERAGSLQEPEALPASRVAAATPASSPPAPPAACCMAALWGGAGRAHFPGDASQAALKINWPVMWHRL